MATLHFLNVKQGDCTWIKHNSGRNTVIDVFNSSIDQLEKAIADESLGKTFASTKGNFGQKNHPVNPIEYLSNHGVSSVFRYIQTHPDMDHMGGIKDFFSAFSPENFWDTENTKEHEVLEGFGYKEEDWDFYKRLRDGPQTNPKRLTLYDGNNGTMWNQDGIGGGDGIEILAPTPELVSMANENSDFNDGGYVLLFTNHGWKTVISGDSHEKTWEHILENHKEKVSNVDILLAPHHGRGSNRSHEFLDVLNPKVTFFGNANSEHLDYQAWINRGLPKFTNNQGNCLISKTSNNELKLFCTYKKFAESFAEANGWSTFFDEDVKGWFLGKISKN